MSLRAELKFDIDISDIVEAYKELEKILPSKLHDALIDIVMKWVGESRGIVAVKTGRLKNSIDSTVEKLSNEILKGIVGSNVHYAPFQEIVHPYLHPAFEQNIDWFEERIIMAVNEAVEEAKP